MPEELQLDVGGTPVSALLERPRFARALMVLAHGAGAGMRHQFMEAMAEMLAIREIATLRYQFPYIERRGFRPDPRPVLLATVEAAVVAGQTHAGGLPLVAGGKSMGGRMTSMAAAEGRLPPTLRGIVFFGFPLHPAGRPGTDRAEHLPDVPVPTLFLQGTRDKLAGLDLLTPILDALPHGRMHVVDGADHGFHMLKRSGRTDAEVLEELADVAAAFIDEVGAVIDFTCTMPIHVAVIELPAVEVGTGDAPFLALGACAAAYRQSGATSPADVPGVQVARSLFRALNIDPTRRRPSSEALLQRALKDKPLPKINTLVDVGNWCSLDFLLPLGLYDLARLDGPVTLRLGAPGESYDAIGGKTMNLEDRYLLADARGAFGSPITDSLRAAVTTDTTASVVFVYAPGDYDTGVLRGQAETMAGRIAEHCGGVGEIEVVSG